MEGCVSENGLELLMEKVEECLNTGIIDVEVFN
jgi:hypothetical protein